MATISGIKTIGNALALIVASDPSGGTVAPIGSFSSATDGSGFYVKTGSGDTGWNKVALLTSGVLPPSLGGTGVANSGTFTNASNTTITGGGTIALGGFTLTVPATGTVTLGTGTSGQYALWNGTNTVSGSTAATYTGTVTTWSVSSNGNVSSNIMNANTGTAAQCFFQAANAGSAAIISMGVLGTGFTTSGLLVANLARITTTTTAVGTLFSSSNSAAKYWWSIGGTATANLIMTLDTTALTLAESVNLITGTTTGTKIGTATTQKIGFWNATPIIQPASANQAALTNNTGGTYNGTLVDVGAVFSQANINDNFTDVFTLLNEIRTVLVNTGIMKGSA